MKIKQLHFVLFTAIILFGGQAMYAQKNVLQQISSNTLLQKHQKTDKTHRPFNIMHQGGNAQVAAKGTAVVSRLIGIGIARYDGADYTLVDTLALSYSGDRTEGALNIDSINDGLINFPFDTTTVWAYDAGTSTYTNMQKTIKTFDNNNNVLSTTGVAWAPNLGVYRNAGLETNTYDANNNMLTTTDQTWDTITNAWVNTYLTTNTYTGSNLTTQLNQTWTGSWTNDSRYNYTYDANNNNTLEVDETWSGGAWVNEDQYTLTYNAANLPLTALVQEWNGTAWDNDNRYTLTYDANNNTLGQLSEQWSAGAWTNQDSIAATYDGSNNMTAYTDQQWTTMWENQSKDTFAYDGSHNQVLDITQSWDGGSWLNYARLQSSYNGMNQVLVATSDSWDMNSNTWEGSGSDAQERFYYQTFNTGVATVPNKGGDVKIYPSPASNVVNIDLNWDVQQSATVAIYDASGRVCRQWQVPAANKYHAQIPVGQLATGTYFVRVKGQQGQLEKTISVVH